MTKPELIALCEKYQVNDLEAFKKIVAEFVSIHPDNKVTLAFGMQYSRSIISRFIDGTAWPSQSSRQEIIDFILRRVRRALKIELNAQAARDKK